VSTLVGFFSHNDHIIAIECDVLMILHAGEMPNFMACRCLIDVAPFHVCLIFGLVTKSGIFLPLMLIMMAYFMGRSSMIGHCSGGPYTVSCDSGSMIDLLT
jgi:hypothetical protein